MKFSLLFDELNILLAKLEAKTKQELKDSADDDILDLLITAYVYGVDDANEMMNTKFNVSIDKMSETIFKKIAGEDFVDRAMVYAELGDIEGLKRLAETEMHRDYNQAAYSTATDGGATTKKWIAVMDDKTRDTHWILDGVKVGIDEDFYSVSGDHAPYPGAFQTAEENVNCRCYLNYE